MTFPLLSEYLRVLKRVEGYMSKQIRQPKFLKKAQIFKFKVENFNLINILVNYSALTCRCRLLDLTGILQLHMCRMVDECLSVRSL